MTHEAVKVLSDRQKLLLANCLEQFVLVALDFSCIFEFLISLGELVAHFHLCIELCNLIDFITFFFVVIDLLRLLEKMSLELKLVF